MTRHATLAISLVFATFIASAPAQEKVEDSPYYPLKVGNAWTFQTFDGQKKVTLVNKVVAHEKIGDVMCAKIQTFVGPEAGPGPHEHIAVTKDGIYRYALNGLKFDPPILLMKLPPTPGDEWNIESKYDKETIKGSLKTAEEKLTVPAGAYKAFVASGKLGTKGETIGAANYFVKDIGIAKIKMEVFGMPLVIELEKFEPAK